VKLVLAPVLMLASAGTLSTGGARDGRLVSLAVGISALATIVGTIYGVRYKIAYEVEVRARQGEAALNTTLEDRIRTLAHERGEALAKLDQATDTLAKANTTIARLEPLNDMARVLELVTDSFERLVNRQEEMHTQNRQDVEAREQRIIAAIQGLAA
jgi:hypothetical protein